MLRQDLFTYLLNSQEVNSLGGGNKEVNQEERKLKKQGHF